MLPPMQILYSSIGGVSVCLYLFLIISILYFRRKKEKEYLSPFFAIFTSLGIADICEQFCTFFFGSLPFDPNLQQFYLGVGNANGHLLARFGEFAMNLFGFAQFGGHLLISINRYTAMGYPIKHDKIWSGRNTIIAISMQWIISFLLTAYIPFVDSSFNVVGNDYIALFIDYQISPVANTVINLFSASVKFIICVASLSINLLALKNYRKTHHNKIFIQSNHKGAQSQQNVDSNRRRRFEVQLFVFGFVTFFFMLPIAILQILMTLATMTNNFALLSVINAQWPWAGVVSCDANPYILLITSGLLRNRIWKGFIGQKTIVVAVLHLNSSRKMDTLDK